MMSIGELQLDLLVVIVKVQSQVLTDYHILVFDVDGRLGPARAAVAMYLAPSQLLVIVPFGGTGRGPLVNEEGFCEIVRVVVVVMQQRSIQLNGMWYGLAWRLLSAPLNVAAAQLFKHSQPLMLLT